MIPYPTSLPLDDIATLVTDFRAGQIAGDSPRVAKSVWELAGFAAYKTLGEPNSIVVPTPAPVPSGPVVQNPIHMAMQSAPSLSTNQVLEYLELFLAHAKKDLTAVVEDLPWQAILKWALTQLLGAI